MSTEFKVGLDETNRNSSKVLKPPGGGSSNIFGFYTDEENASPRAKKNTGSTKSRIFGNEYKDEVVQPESAAPSLLKQEEPPLTPRSLSKITGRRNPITGEGLAHEPECKSEKANGTAIVEKPRVVQTSIRVRNPPGGASSGIF